MQNGVKGMCKYLLSISAVSLDDLTSLMENLEQKKKELGIAEIKWMERRVLDKAANLVKRKEEKQREKSISLGSEMAFLSIMKKFSTNSEKDSFIEGGVRQ